MPPPAGALAECQGLEVSVQGLSTSQATRSILQGSPTGPRPPRELPTCSQPRPTSRVPQSCFLSLAWFPRLQRRGFGPRHLPGLNACPSVAKETMGLSSGRQQWTGRREPSRRTQRCSGNPLRSKQDEVILGQALRGRVLIVQVVEGRGVGRGRVLAHGPEGRSAVLPRLKEGLCAAAGP